MSSLSCDCFFYYMINHLILSFSLLGLLTFFALALYGIKQKTVGKEKLVVSFGYSYICGWISGMLSCVAAVIGFYDVRKHPVPPARGTIEITVSTDSLEAEVDANADADDDIV